MKTLAVVAKAGKPEAALLTREIRDRYPSLEVLAQGHLAELLGWPPQEDEAVLSRAELIAVMGGDGTLIHAARLLHGRPVPILGINLGTLGFMTEVPKVELFGALDEILAGRFSVDRRMKLTCRLFRDEKLILEDEVLNDVVISKGALARIADHAVTIDGEYVTTYKSDGIILATPTGSTAYSMSAGGPIVHPATDAVVIAPICPHALTQRAIVIPGDRAISISLPSEVADVYLTLDGQVGHPIRTGDRLEVSRSPSSVLLVRNPKRSYFSILRQKLHWGER